MFTCPPPPSLFTWVYQAYTVYSIGGLQHDLTLPHGRGIGGGGEGGKPCHTHTHTHEHITHTLHFSTLTAPLLPPPSYLYIQYTYICKYCTVISKVHTTCYIEGEEGGILVPLSIYKIMIYMYTV